MKFSSIQKATSVKTYDALEYIFLQEGFMTNNIEEHTHPYIKIMQ